MKKYRFKTEEEFIEEFGEYWSSEVQPRWNSGKDGMNFLLGTELELRDEEEKQLLSKETIMVREWTISLQHLIPLELSIHDDIKNLLQKYPAEDLITEILLEVRGK